MKLIKNINLSVCLLFIGISFASSTLAQTSSFIHFGVEQGLTQSQVQTITQDKDGNLWIGTMAGLSKYNGHDFITYTKQNGLAEDWITASVMDKFGNIWFGHWGGGISIYNYDEKKIVNLQLAEVVRFKTITDLFEDSKSHIWIATRGAGLFSYDSDNNKFLILTEKEGLSSNNVLNIAEDSSGIIWCGTDTGVTYFNAIKVRELLSTRKDEVGVKDEIKSLCAYLNTENGLPSNLVLSNIMTSTGKMWLATPLGIAVIDPVNPYEKPFTILNESDGISSLNIQDLYEDNENTIWICTGDKGVNSYQLENSNNNEIKGTFKVFNSKNGLSFDNVNTLMKDIEGNIWVGTDLGLSQYRGDRFLIYDDSDGLVNSVVWSIFEDSEKNIWIGTEGGVSKFQTGGLTDKGSPFINYTIANGFPGNYVKSIIEDKAGNVWFSIYGKGLAIAEKNKKGFKLFNIDDGIASDKISDMSIDKQGNLWFATSEGVSIYDFNKKTFTNYTSEDGLSGNKIVSVFSDSRGNMWFGILGGGLTLFDGKKFKIFDEKDGFDNKLVWCINEDTDGDMWFSGYGAGIFEYNGKSFKNYTVKDGLSSSTIFLISCDKNNNIWIGTSLGIDKFNQEDKSFTHYGKNQGFLGVETNHNAEYVDSDGNIWFGTIMGVVKYNPAKDQPNQIEPKTSITKIQIARQDAELPLNGQFQHDQNHLTFHFIGISLTNPKEVRYQYKLEGFDKNWSADSKDTYVAYSNLPFGNYQFMVRACNNDGLWNANPTIYEFEILTPFWRTWWFYSFCVLIVILLIYLFIIYRIKSIENEKKMLEEKVTLRTSQLNEEKQKLETAYQHIEERNTHITDSIRYAKRIQEAILPNVKKITQFLPESYILYRPKEIVSGDFFWFADKGDYSVIAAVDCTGHGVPGAFMSIIGYTLLNQIVIEKNILDPALILSKLDEGVKIALKQREEGAGTMDGMDIAIAIINKNKKEVKFAGALRPLFWKNNGTITEIKGDKYSIGGQTLAGGTRYTTHNIEVNKENIIYMFSDGVPDQFGGTRCKKLTKKGFRDMLAGCVVSNMSDQHKWLSKEIDTWKGNEEQTDDIMIIAVKF